MFRLGLKPRLRSGCRVRRTNGRVCRVRYREKIRSQPAAVGDPTMSIGQTHEPVPFDTWSWPDDTFDELRRAIEKREAPAVPSASATRMRHCKGRSAPGGILNATHAQRPARQWGLDGVPQAEIRPGEVAERLDRARTRTLRANSLAPMPYRFGGDSAFATLLWGEPVASAPGQPAGRTIHD